MANKEDAASDCFNHFADGSDAPSGCQIKRFTTFDLYASWAGIKNLTIYGSIKNLTDEKSPFDPNVYSAFHYNPIYHLSGAVGRQFNVGVKYQF
jgi:iron complex outermembrane receptor protein